MLVTKTITVCRDIDRCYHQCPHFSTNGEGMYCTHPKFDGCQAYENFIISHPKCDTGFPDDCPLIN